MSNRLAFWSIFGGAVLCVLVYLWFILNFDRVAYETRTPPGSAALRNSYLAAERLLQQLGYRVQTVQDAASLESLPPGGTLILGGERQFHLTRARVDALFRWVEQGGYLLADTAMVGASDPILRRLDVHRSAPLRGAPQQATAQDEDDGEADVQRRREARLANSPNREPPRSLVAIPGYGRTLRMRAGADQLAAGRIAPEWAVHGVPEGKQKTAGEEVLHFRLGRGHVALVNGLSRFGNYAIAVDDHAEVLAALCAVYQPRGEVRIMTRLAVPSLWRWLADHAQAALVSAALLLALWLWRIVPRFGVARPEAPSQRRSLIEHLRAMGRFLWRRRALEVLVDASRHNLRSRLTLRHAGLSGLTSSELAAHLAHQTGISLTAIARALEGDAHEPERYTATMKTLRELEQKL
jgi:hypothetical protein